MESVKIFYFSGTGNTKKVTEMLMQQLDSNGIHVQITPIEDYTKNNKPIDIKQSDMIGLSFPIYGFSAPSIVYDFIRLLPSNLNKKLFLLACGADFISINHYTFIRLIRELGKKNISVLYSRIIVMPSNWLVPYTDTFIKQLVECARKKVIHMCRDLLDGNTRTYNPRGFVKCFSKSLSWLERTYGSTQFGLSLWADKSCNQCNICVKNCPVNNIRWDSNTLKFSDKCLICMRCIYNCPQNSIKSKGYNFTVLKDGYNIDRVLEDTSIGDTFVTKQTRGFYRHFYRYINNIEVWGLTA